MKRNIYLIAVIFVVFMYGCSTDCTDYQTVTCISEINSNVDTLKVGDTIFFKSSINDYIIYNFKKQYDISDVYFTCAFIVKPINSKFGETDFDNIQSTVADFTVYSSSGEKQSLMEYFGTKNQAIAGVFKHQDNKMQANYYLVAQDTGLFAVKLSTDVVKTHKTGHCDQNFDIEYSLNSDTNFTLNKLYIKEEQCYGKYLVVRINP